MSTPKSLELWLYNDEEEEIALLVRSSSSEFILQGGRDTVSVSIAPRDSVALSVTFAPLTPGPKSTEVVVQGDRRATVPCTGRAESDACSLEPAEIDFGSVPTGSTRTQDVVVRNLGTVGFSGDVSEACADFEVTEGSGTYTLEPGDSLRITLAFSPETIGPQLCSLSLGTPACEPVGCTGTGSRVWYVKADGTGDAPTVQAAIDSSADGQMVLVGPGTYFENINLRGKAIHLKSELGPEQTVLDGSSLDSSVVVCNSDERNNTVIEGFTITGGRGTTYNTYSKRGGGIFCFLAAPTIRRNVVSDNASKDISPAGHSRGGGIHVDAPLDGTPVLIQACIVSDNVASANGGGIATGRGAIIQESWIEGNKASGADGGGVWLMLPTAGSRIEHNTIIGNSAGDHGGGIYVGNASDVDPTTILIEHNRVLRNTSTTLTAMDCSGGGVWIYGGATVRSNTIAFNMATNVSEVPAAGGCCIILSLPGTRLAYNLFYNNIGGGVVSDERSIGEITNNLIYGHEGLDLYLAEGAEFSVHGNIFDNPLLCDTTSTSLGELAYESPALQQPTFVIGAVKVGSCHRTPDVATTWKAVKEFYR